MDGFKIPNGYRIVAICGAGFIGVHRINGKYIVGQFKKDCFENQYVDQTARSDGLMYYAEVSPGSSAWKNVLMAKLMAEHVSGIQSEIKEAQANEALPPDTALRQATEIISTLVNYAEQEAQQLDDVAKKTNPDVEPIAREAFAACRKANAWLERHGENV